ncbi:hypothetical protein [cyanobacterium endosymbiont of Epithemia turgida]|uniref:hypothetical protein n=1 Tax=cyanobacterium endosymbiont of Epithemia turgida TaxID=718217 RepID=UPI0004D117FA|nr:hypothetical protein [cyanobacterium endosymbiont of Epithemia turgida]BAP17507.1 hypothetical protein ETSB_0684 [cyanobacterium endosymbiont of Epithemia turgida isolate EtSB Lake Yunoko]
MIRKVSWEKAVRTGLLGVDYHKNYESEATSLESSQEQSPGSKKFKTSPIVASITKNRVRFLF